MNSIPSSAHMKVDLRSESETEPLRSKVYLRDAVKAGIDEEVSAARERGMAGSANLLSLKINVLGVRLGFLRSSQRIRRSRPLCWRPTTSLATVRAANGSSTDANIPLSLGIQAISLGAGGRSGGAHTHSTNGTTPAAGNSVCSASVALTVLGVAGLEP